MREERELVNGRTRNRGEGEGGAEERRKAEQEYTPQLCLITPTMGIMRKACEPMIISTIESNYTINEPTLLFCTFILLFIPVWKFLVD